MSLGANLTSEQDRARLATDKHIAVTANAGAGKTKVFAERFIQIFIDNRNVKPEECLAITFTKKAAAEILERIIDIIEEEIDELSNSQVQTHIQRIADLKEIREGINPTVISTIDSFFTQLLKEFPHEIEIDANFTIISNREQREIIDTILEDLLNLQTNEQHPIKSLVREIAPVFGSQQNFNSALLTLFNKRKEFERIYGGFFSEEDSPKKQKEQIEQLDHIALLQPIMHKIQNRAENIVQICYENNIDCFLSFMAYYKEHSPANVESVPQQVLDYTQLSFKEKIKLVSEITNSCKDLFSSTGNNALLKNKVIGKGDKGTEKEKLFLDAKNSLTNIDIDALVSDSEPSILFSIKLMKITAWVLADYSHRKRELGYLDFPDLILLSRKLILGNTEQSQGIRALLKERLKFIMIDEYQDTDKIQYDFFKMFIETELGQKFASNLFVVGDPKQSIYRFRDADVTVFSSTIKEMEKTGKAETIEFPHSFRMVPQLAALINLLTTQLFPNNVNSKAEQLFISTPINTETICGRSEKNKPVLNTNPVKLLFSLKRQVKGPDGKMIVEQKHTIEQLVARAMIKYANEIIESGTADTQNVWSNFAVLSRTNRDLAKLALELNKAGIPYNYPRGDNFFKQTIIIELIDYLRALLNIRNDVALATALTSPLFRIAQSDLIALGNYHLPLFERLKKSDAPLMRSAVETILRHHKIAHEASPLDLFDIIVQETHLKPLLVTKPNGRDLIAQVVYLRTLISKSIEQRSVILYDVIQSLDLMIESPLDHNIAPPQPLGDAVNLLTIHGSKGLQFNIVFIIGANKERQKVDGYAKKQTIELHSELGILAKLPETEGNMFEDYQDNIFTVAARLIEDVQEEEEFKRLAYVAITRAKDILILADTIDATSEEKIFNKSGTILSRVLNATGLSDALVQHLAVSSENSVFTSLPYNQPVWEQGVNDGEPQKKEIAPVVDLIVDIEPEEIKKTVAPPKEYKLNLGAISSTEGIYALSASKLAKFNQCPRKYYLSYELGFSSLRKLSNEYKESELTSEDFEVEHTDSEEKGYEIKSDFLGRIIHYLLENDCTASEIPELTSRYLKNEFPNNINKQWVADIVTSVSNVLIPFLSSPVYTAIQQRAQKTVPLNEYQLHSIKHNTTLFGIIDRIFFEGNSVYIVDWKTNRLPDTETMQRLQAEYQVQMEFYVALITILQPNVTSVTTHLVFLQNPELSQPIEYKGEKLKTIAEGVFSQIINYRESIQTRTYQANRNHCSHCDFANNKAQRVCCLD